MLDEVKFGSITIVIQDGKIMQVQKEEKIRI
ncbi:MAG: YezD family protein [Candidatus Choladocola sp.]|nr:YezD family protein [Candidatus Choladocola sp.]